MSIDQSNVTRNCIETDVLPIVGIGASAGGLRSLELFFDNLPSETGMAYVVVQHLSPDFKSLMSEILARHTTMPVCVAEDGMNLEPNKVYLIPPGKELRCDALQLKLSEFGGGMHRPIDVFFESIACNAGIPAIGIVLSGTGSDGSIGIKSIHEMGGVTIAESLDTAAFDGMPTNAIKTGCVKFVMPPDQIADAMLKEFSKELASPPEEELDLASISLIYAEINRRHNLRFDEYKLNTMVRRIERRMTLGRHNSIKDYAKSLVSDENEVDELYHDLLIGVTRFFRDEEAYRELHSEIRASLKNFPADDTFRVWISGCATGEEAYSIAMLVLDSMEELGRVQRLKVLATDVHHRALEHAAFGCYQEQSLEHVSDARRKKYFFALDDGTYRVTSELRKHIVFANHNLFQDPPYTNMDLVSCRNMIIYLKSETQLSCISSLNFSLSINGIMFLGASETPGRFADSFKPASQKWKVYRKIAHDTTSITKSRQLRKIQRTPQRPTNLINNDPSPLNVSSLLNIYESALRARVELGVVLDSDQRIVYMFGETNKILKGESGRFSGLISSFLPAHSRATIMATLIRAQKDPLVNVVAEQVQLDPQSDELYDVTAVSIKDPKTANVGWILQFEECDRQRPVVRIQQDQQDSYQLLQSELTSTKESLSTSTEQLETSNHELQATNEELIASNEELQSTNEELCSVNEELHSVNEEYQRKIGELEETTDDLEMLIRTSDIGTIFLDCDLCIRKFSWAATRYFNLVRHDVGRPLTDFRMKLVLPSLHDLLSSVIENGDTVTTTCVDVFNERVFVKIIPNTKGGNVVGAVLSVINHAASFPDLSTLMTFGTVGAWEWPNIKADTMWWSPTCYKLVGLSNDFDPTFDNWRSLIHPDDLSQLDGLGNSQCRMIEFGDINVRMKCGDGEYRRFEFRNIAKVQDSGTVTGLAGTVTASNLIQNIRGNESRRIEQLEQTERDYREFTTAVSKDLNASIARLTQRMDSIEQEKQNGDKNELVSRFSLLAQDLNAQLRSLADYASVDENIGGTQLCDPNEVILDVKNTLQVLLKDLNADVTTGNIPEIHANPDHLQTLFFHLFNNSIQNAGHKALRIKIAAVKEANGVKITFDDNSAGIDPECLRDAFIVARRSDNPTAIRLPSYSLPICKRIIESYGGQIWAEKLQVYEGTRISISFPMDNPAINDSDMDSGSVES